MTSQYISGIFKIGASEPPRHNTQSYKNEYTQVSKPEVEEGVDHDSTLCVKTPTFPEKFKIFKMHINSINAVTNCLISYILLDSLFELSVGYISDRIVLFSLLTLFLFATTRETVMQNWARYLLIFSSLSSCGLSYPMC